MPLADVVGCLQASTGTTDHRVVAALLDRVRHAGPDAGPLGEHLAMLLPHQAPLYQGRDKWEVLRLRSYVFATLSDIGVPASAVPMLTDTLIYPDERMRPVEYGAAVRAAGTLGAAGSAYIPHMLSAISERFAEEEFSLERYELDFPRKEATTIQLEIVRALALMVRDSGSEAVTVLRSIAASSKHSSLDPRLIAAARDALSSIEQHVASGATAGTRPAGTAIPIAERIETLTPWLEPQERKALQRLDVRLEDHDGGEHQLRQLVDRPVLLTFFYTRCQNSGKCSTAIARLARLQRELRQEGLANRVRLLALSFEPDIDSPTRLKRYAADRGLSLNPNAAAGRLDVAGHADFVKELDAPVSYSGGWVNTHGVESVLLDADGRIARKYTTLGWEPATVIRDFRTLLAGG